MSYEEVVIRSEGRSEDFLALRAEPRKGRNDFPRVMVELRCGNLRATSILPPFIGATDRLPAFFRELHDQWRGWDGRKTLGLAEDDPSFPEDDIFAISAVHDSKGHVDLTFYLADRLAITPWAMRASFGIDVGSARAIADAIEQWSYRVAGKQL